MRRYIQMCTAPCHETRRPECFTTLQSSLSDHAHVSATLRSSSSFPAYQSRGGSYVWDRAAYQGTSSPLEALTSKCKDLNGMSQVTRATQRLPFLHRTQLFQSFILDSTVLSGKHCNILKTAYRQFFKHPSKFLHNSVAD
jgi:hypothetical protein